MFRYQGGPLDLAVKKLPARQDVPAVEVVLHDLLDLRIRDPDAAGPGGKVLVHLRLDLPSAIPRRARAFEETALQIATGEGAARRRRARREAEPDRDFDG
jgi:hypothetical protein